MVASASTQAGGRSQVTYPAEEFGMAGTVAEEIAVVDTAAAGTAVVGTAVVGFAMADIAAGTVSGCSEAAHIRIAPCHKEDTVSDNNPSHCRA